MQPCFNSADVLTFDSPLLADTKYLCWIKLIMNTFIAKNLTPMPFFKYSMTTFHYYQFFFLRKIMRIVSLIHIQFCSRNDRSEKECKAESFHPNQFKQTEKTFSLKIYFCVRQWIYTFLEERKKTLLWSSEKVAFYPKAHLPHLDVIMYLSHLSIKKMLCFQWNFQYCIRGL